MSPLEFVKLSLSLAGATIAPPLILSKYLGWTGDPHYSSNSDMSGLGALAIAVLVGTFGVHCLAGIFNWYGGKLWKAAVILASYIVFASLFLIAYAFGYVCTKFDACL